ncbi:hypothetical protein L204_104473 [Cryptococcus depauperatus]
MGGRQGGKVKPLKAPKKLNKELDDDDVALKEKLKKEKADLKKAADMAAQKGPMGGAGLKKSKRTQTGNNLLLTANWVEERFPP